MQNKKILKSEFMGSDITVQLRSGYGGGLPVVYVYKEGKTHARNVIAKIETHDLEKLIETKLSGGKFIIVEDGKGRKYTRLMIK